MQRPQRSQEEWSLRAGPGEIDRPNLAVAAGILGFGRFNTALSIGFAIVIAEVAATGSWRSGRSRAEQQRGHMIQEDRR